MAQPRKRTSTRSASPKPKRVPRRNAAQKRRGRRRRSGQIRAVLALFCTVVTVAALLCAATVFFRVDTITVTGTSPYSDQEIISATGLEPGSSLIFFEKNRAIRQLFEACPYLETVRIHRKYPDALEIIVTQSQPMAVIESGDAAYVISTGGKILMKTRQPEKTGLCIVTGAVLEDPVVGKTAKFSSEETRKPLILALNTFLENDILEEIGAVCVEELYDITFTYTNRFKVKIGTTDDLDRKLRYMQTLINEKIGLTATGTIDVSDVRTARFIPD